MITNLSIHLVYVCDRCSDSVNDHRVAGKRRDRDGWTGREEGEGRRGRDRERERERERGMVKRAKEKVRGRKEGKRKLSMSS